MQTLETKTATNVNTEVFASTMEEFGFDSSFVEKFNPNVLTSLIRQIEVMISLDVKDPEEILTFYILGNKKDVDDTPNKYVQKINSQNKIAFF